MRQVAQYVFSASLPDANLSSQRAASCHAAVEQWIITKGCTGKEDFELRDGRSAHVTREHTSSSEGSVHRWMLLEEIEGGFFETRLGLAVHGVTVHASCSISVGHGSNRLAPLRFEAKCPAIVRHLLDLPIPWKLGSTAISTTPMVFRGAPGGAACIELLSRSDRALPVVAVSSHFGLLLHPELPNRFARDLAALAIVAVLDDEAAWAITSRLGRTWSCYNGAIRVYWPGFKPEGTPLAHPLWTAQRLLDGRATVDDAERRIRDTIRKRLMAVSVPALSEPGAFVAIHASHLRETEEAKRREATDSSDFRALAESFDQEATGLKGEVETLQTTIMELRRQLYRYQIEEAWTDAGDGVAPEDEAEPDTVEEAVGRARTRLAGSIRFGQNVDNGVQGLFANAGPPPKVLTFLEALSDMAQARRSGSLGTGMIAWLSARGVTSSDEATTVLNDKSAMSKRTWDDGAGNRRPFHLHLKPNEGTAPDKCVRIYFAWDDASDQVVVGWVGRHL